MNKKTADWLLSKTMPEQNTMFENVKLKIGGYKTTYGLSNDWITSVILICDTFTEAYSGVMENRATAKQMDTWFKELLEAKTENAPAAQPPVFTQIALPAGALEGLYKSFRKKMDFFKSNENYTRADGENLMIVAAEGTERNIEDAFPEFKMTVSADNEIAAAYTRREFGGAETQWRAAGSETWLAGDKSGETVVRWTPTGIELPAKIEVRGIYLLKNKRVGKWSPIYVLTIG